MVAAVAEEVMTDTVFDVEAFLAVERGKDLVRFTTAGSVDDGKSTLIGRLLYDSKGVYEDQLRSVQKASVNKSAGAIDFSLLTDGLRAEREQGITIDVAYRYFSTAKRKFIIADTPGHEQYTRNMATGASTADLAIILIDARNGVLQQSRRHAYIASLLGIRQLVVAINKMDLVGYDSAVFDTIRDQFTSFLAELGNTTAYFLPISALAGDNVVKRSNNMRWFDGLSLLEYLETVEITPAPGTAFRFPVQRTVRPDQTFRGYAGQIASGSIQPGDPVLILPSGYRTRVKSISTFDGDLPVGYAPMSVTLTLEQELDISRGDLISSATQLPAVSRQLESNLVWFSADPLDLSRPYLLKHCTQTVTAEIKRIDYRINLNSLEREPVTSLEMNGIGVVTIETSRPLSFDPYAQNRITGSFILIDPVTNGTVAAGMITRSLALETQRASSQHAAREHAQVTAAERMGRYGHRSAAVSLGGRSTLAVQLERLLFDRGCSVVVLPSWQPDAVSALEQAGCIVLVISGDAPPALPDEDFHASEAIVKMLAEQGVLIGHEDLTGGEGI
ncbi:MAG: sulfate adenylyltransferase subunit CysN [Acidobacteriota bacterium]|nr:sulfate adenylyltransferase subunit CysN [Acidobacteriota bacterium]